MDVAMRILPLLLAAYVAAVAVGTRAEAQSYPWCAITAAGRSAAAQIAALQHFNNAWTPRAASAAFASQIRNTSIHRGRIHRRSCEGAIHIEWLARQLPDDD